MFEYSEPETSTRSLVTLVIISILSAIFIYQWDIFALAKDILPTFQTSWLPSEAVAIWRFGCFLVGFSAIVYMFRMETGVMPVLEHQSRNEIVIHPIGIEKFVTFSSWNLILNTVYFSIASLISLSLLIEFDIPRWLEIVQVLIFSTALGSAFITSTIVRHLILPGEVRIRRKHDHQFLYHNQIMHNFAAIFIAIEIIIIRPELQPHFAIFGLILGLLYALFAYPFAYFGGGYYVYSFIDPRLRLAPLLLTGLGGAISLFYLGMWLVTILISYNQVVGSLVTILWVSLIVQFRSEKFEAIK